MNNPLISDFEFAPFDSIQYEHFEPAFDFALKEAYQEIEDITTQTEIPSFENTIEKLEASGRKLDRISSILFNLNAAETSEKIQQIAQKVSPLLSKFQNDIILDEKLFLRVKEVYQLKEKLQLTKEQERLLEHTYLNFQRNGANLDEVKQKRLREIDEKLAQLSLQFGQNSLAESNAFKLHLTQKSDLDGLPDYAIEMAKNEAENEGKEGYIFTLQYPSYLAFMKFAKNRALRKQMAIAFGKKGFQDNPHNNEKIVLEIVSLRLERANLLGFDTHADFVLQQRMAKNPETVQGFLNELLAKTKQPALKELEELKAFAKEKEGINNLQKWDVAYFSEQLKQQKFSINEDQLKPFFELSKVVNGVFEIAKKLAGLHFEAIDTIPTYHEEVTTYKVTDEQGNYVAILYTDFHPRPGKRDGAWMTVYKNQYIENGENSRPHISIVCNFTRPTKKTPSLLTFNEVTTLFHEFGHALHGMLANTTYASLSGTSVFWDFVELPSQLLENWCYEEEALSLFAKHYQTEELIPIETIQKIKASANFQEGMQTLRQLSFGMLDMAWHNTKVAPSIPVKKIEIKALEVTQLLPDVEENCMSTSFGHIFQGGYAAGYYSYKWAEVLDADAFAFFKQKGIFNKEVANSFKENILTKGGTEDPMELYVRFRGQEPSIDALLKRAGLS